MSYNKNIKKKDKDAGTGAGQENLYNKKVGVSMQLMSGIRQQYFKAKKEVENPDASPLSKKGEASSIESPSGRRSSVLGFFSQQKKNQTGDYLNFLEP